MDLFEALRCYFESRNVALSSVGEIREIMLASRGWVPLESLSGQQRRTASLLWLVGLLNVVVGVVGGRPRLAGYRLSRVGRVYVDLLRDSPGASDLFLAEVLAGWAPMRNLLIYSLGRRTVTVDGVERDLGSQIEEATGRAFALLRAFGILRRGAPVKKPYNRHVIEALLFKLGRELGLYSGTRSEVELTELGEHIARKHLVRGPEVVKTGPNYPLVLAAVIAILCRAREASILTPWISPRVAERLARGLAGSEIRRLTIVTRRDPKNLQSVGLLRANLRADVEHRVYDQLHSKIVVSQEDGLVSSANLMLRSLFVNFETGIYFRLVPDALMQHVDEIIYSAQSIT